MTIGGEAAPDGGGEFAIVPPSGRICAEEGCDNPLPDGSHPARKFCDEHFVGKAGRKAKKTERPPASVNIHLKSAGGKKDDRAAATAGGATAFMQMAAAGAAMLSGGNAESPWLKDSAVMRMHSEDWGNAVGDLSKYQPWLQSVFAPVGGDNQMKAIFTLVVITGAIVVPCLSHHNMLPGEVGAMIGGVFMAAEQADGSQQQPAA